MISLWKIAFRVCLLMVVALQELLVFVFLLFFARELRVLGGAYVVCLSLELVCWC